MKKIILAVTALTLSAGAFASIDTNHKARSINAGVYASQEQAYAAGFKKIEQLQALPSNKLANELSVWQNSVVPKSVKIDDTEVVVQSFAKQPGVVEYRSIVKVDYQYKTRESNRD
ncbi:DUF3316 domain-containing protein [Vibrio cholerae]|uniref:DUF3316 domain-containing protein n=1 Tax=Vibrio cholerae TaxID=666 RepID=UPI00069EBC58|nr:DUF3316 domain-containing protein [Vibrio cholerae]MDF4533180.1 DUF3316 domain-containing protein [Vibrio parahaemolyticus]HAS2386016.1 DUF3316 domain-containing protein [Vibrio cholerae O1]EGR0597162.1 DUF3316 domain-containing protein [Vibrio cholerae]EGR1047509.1 DUF3316 domain-containing protein [Vibrio cholerae]EGR4200814.1 DUF3316 domain-containing protein [Vibrio cholerae]